MNSSVMKLVSRIYKHTSPVPNGRFFALTVVHLSIIILHSSFNFQAEFKPSFVFVIPLELRTFCAVYLLNGWI